MATDTDRLRAGLEDYRSTLLAHATRLEAEYSDLQSVFVALFDAYSGRAADQMHHEWSISARWLEEHIRTTHALARFLEERIEHLRSV